MKTQNRVLLGLITVALLATVGTVFAVAPSAWTVENRNYNPQGTLILQPTHATVVTGSEAQFNFPSATNGYTAYLWTGNKPLSLGEKITATITVAATSDALFTAGPWGQSASPPAVVYLFFQANTPVDKADQASCMPPGFGANNYWWAAATPITDSLGKLLGDGTFTVSATLDPSVWSGICGALTPAQSAHFAQALASATHVGLAFGGGPGGFGANGVGMTAGTATFTLNSYTVS